METNGLTSLSTPVLEEAFLRCHVCGPLKRDYHHYILSPRDLLMVVWFTWAPSTCRWRQVKKTKKMNFSELFSHYISFMSAQSERRSYLDRDLWKTVPATLFNNLCNSYWSLPDSYSWGKNRIFPALRWGKEVSVWMDLKLRIKMVPSSSGQETISFVCKWVLSSFYCF